jgi:hypothetical protein
VSAEQFTIRTARKAGRCANHRAAAAGNAKACKVRIEVGDQYAEGESSIDIAGGFGRDRICMGCVEAGDA